MSDYLLYTFTTNTFSIPNITTNDKLWLTIKGDSSLDDTHSLLQIEKTAGLLYVNSQAIPITTPAVASTDGSIVINGLNLDVTLKPVASGLLPIATELYGEVKSKNNISGVVSILSSFTVDFVNAVTHVI